MKKAFILMLYGTALYWILREYYKQGNTGLPTPKTLAAPTYLYGILSLSSDFTGGFTIPLAAGLTTALIWQVQARNATPKTGYVGPSGPSQTKFTNNDPGMHSAAPTPAQVARMTPAQRKANANVNGK